MGPFTRICALVIILIAQQKLSYTKKQLQYGGLHSAVRIVCNQNGAEM